MIWIRTGCYYLAMAPQFFGPIVTHLKGQQIVTDKGFNASSSRKPFGMDYASAEKLNNQITQVFPEEDIFRIDHYLGKRNDPEYSGRAFDESVPGILVGIVITSKMFRSLLLRNWAWRSAAATMITAGL